MSEAAARFKIKFLNNSCLARSCSETESATQQNKPHETMMPTFLTGDSNCTRGEQI